VRGLEQFGVLRAITPVPAVTAHDSFLW